MRLFKINDITIDIDENTAIGITLQTYDIKEPGQRKIKISNTFNIPKTANNMAVIGFAGDVQFNNDSVYNVMIADYWIDNEKLIDQAKVRVMEVGDRISLFVFQKDDIWDNLKLLLWPQFVTEFIDWMQTHKSLPSELNPFTGTLGEFLGPYLNPSSDIILPMYYGNLYNHVFNKIGDTYSFSFSETQTTFILISDFTYDLTNWDSSGSNNISTFKINTEDAIYPYRILKGETYSFEINIMQKFECL